MSTLKSMHTNIVYALAALFLILGIFGYLDIKNFTTAGYNSNDFEVTRVEDAGPAATAGMQVGDQILTIDGRDVRDTKAWTDVPRTKPGETRNFVVDRGGEEVSFPLTYAAMSSGDSNLTRVGWTMGLVFLLMALWAFRSKKSWASYLFAMFGLGFAGSFMGGPHIENNLLSDLDGVMRLSFVLLSFVFLVDFLLHFPKKSSFVSTANASKKLYGPAIFLILFFLIITLLKTDASSGLNNFIQYAIFAFVVFYFVWAIILMFKKYSNATAEEKAGGVSLMFWGTIIGLVPILIGFIASTFMPSMELPGEDYYFLTMGLIPICFAMAINKSGGDSSDSGGSDGDSEE